MRIFAKRLREALAKNKISQNAFAKMIGFSQQTINCWCMGKREPDFDTLILISDKLKVSLDFLLRNDNGNNNGK
jgi:transcriptional regulator with XRE-family HTH domain